MHPGALCDRDITRFNSCRPVCRHNSRNGDRSFKRSGGRRHRDRAEPDHGSGTFHTYRRGWGLSDSIDTDFSLIKDTKLHERIDLQFRADAFDVFNHPNFGNPDLNVLSSSFGIITSTRFANGDFGSARQMQLGLKLMF